MIAHTGDMKWVSRHAGIAALAELIQTQVYDQPTKDKWAQLIKDFNELYYDLSAQTWGITTWRGVRVLKPPTDLWVYQELIQEIRPDLIIETGTFAGGSALFMRDVLDKVNLAGRVVSIDTHPENRDGRAVAPRLQFIEGSSSDPVVVDEVAELAEMEARVMVILDSCHDREHVLAELDLYGPLVTVGSILIVEDGSNHDGPRAAIQEWFPAHPEFQPNLMGEKYMLTFNRNGYWEKVA